MSKGKNIAYVRVSTLEQNEARQREALQPYNIDKWFIEKASGKDTQRPKLQEMLEYIREDDTVYVEEFSRLGRSTADLLAIVQQIEDSGATFISLKEKFDTHTPAGKLQMTMIPCKITSVLNLIKNTIHDNFCSHRDCRGRSINSNGMVGSWHNTRCSRPSSPSATTNRAVTISTGHNISKRFPFSYPDSGCFILSVSINI